MYYNAKTLIPKLDKQCATMDAHNPYMTYIVETSWLCADILKLPIPGYQVYRRDKYGHGGDYFVCNLRTPLK